MQFHLDGFRAGDPAIFDALAQGDRGEGLPDEVDILIVGCGPAGLALAAQMSAFPNISTAIIEQKDGALLLGQADGIACRTMEMFEAFGFAHEIEREAYWVNETVFWKPASDGKSGIERNGRVQDVEDGLSEFPHVILNQARVHDRFLTVMRNSPSRAEPYYSRTLLGLESSVDRSVTHPVTAHIERKSGDGAPRVEMVKAKYVVGCDGARSAVRRSIGRALTGDSANQAWGVMDVLAVSDFPDLRYKTAVQSADEGSAMIIPREGGYLTRFYIELGKLSENERLDEKNVTIGGLIAAAQRIFHPYSLDVKEVAWWSCYEIGQRLCDQFDDRNLGAASAQLPRVFIAGDACHTHSPKAGQGMNVSMQDSFNLGWKLAAVLSGRAKEELLGTYTDERQAVAKELIEFDREWAAMFSAQPTSGKHRGDEAKDAGEEGAKGRTHIDPAEFQRYFVKQGRFTAGTATKYRPSMICGDDKWQHLATGLPVGMRFHSAPVIRIADAKPVHLGHVNKADGRWRIFLFAGQDDRGEEGQPLAGICCFLQQNPASPVLRFTPDGQDIDAVFDVRGVFQQSHHDLVFEAMPDLLRPHKGLYQLRDYEKIFCPDIKSGNDLFDLRGIDRKSGCMIAVRPDQYVAQILPLEGGKALGEFFSGFMVEAR